MDFGLALSKRRAMATGKASRQRGITSPVRKQNNALPASIQASTLGECSLFGLSTGS
ncbi:MAG: hypothetical protein M5R42_18765 [Rhodocyclaceae bacterium]|nr:hypothetical protein [Rhodocyclaceae bacterium]